MDTTTKIFHLTSSFLFLLLKSAKLTFKKTCNIRASESLHDVTRVKTWSSRVTGTSVAAYFVYNINFSNLLPFLDRCSRIWTKAIFQNGVWGCRRCIAVTMETRLWGIKPDFICIKRITTDLYIIDHCLNPNPNPNPSSHPILE